MKKGILVIGLGNTLLQDDGVGIYVARELQGRLGSDGEADIVEASVGGFGLLDLMRGYKTVFVVDALKTAESIPGRTVRCSVEDLGSPSQGRAAHFLDLRTAVELGRQCGYDMPRRIEIFAVEIINNTDFEETLTPAVARVVPLLTGEIVAEIQKEAKKPITGSRRSVPES